MPTSIDNSVHHHDRGATTNNTKRIGIALDDFGLHAGINEASLNLVMAKRVSALGCMVGAPAWRDGCKLLKQAGLPPVDIGLHLDFTEHPFRRNSRSSLMMLITKCYTGKVNHLLVREEIRAQLDAFEDAMNCSPVYVDGHQHIHQLPQISNLLLEELTKRYSANSMWLRSTLNGASKDRPSSFNFLELIKPKVIFQLGGQQFAEKLLMAGFKSNGRLLGVYDFTDTQARYRTLMRYWLQTAQDGDLLMCHPSAFVNVTDAISAGRLAEYRYLNSDAFESDLGLYKCAVAQLSSVLFPVNIPISGA
jgi:chitin disaccharide deacetylase